MEEKKRPGQIYFDESWEGVKMCVGIPLMIVMFPFWLLNKLIGLLDFILYKIIKKFK